MKIDLRNTYPWLSEQEIEQSAPQVEDCFQMLLNNTGKGNEFLGWLNLPETVAESVDDIMKATAWCRENLDTFVVIGIGGSYLGTKAVLTSLSKYFSPKTRGPEILFAGHHLDSDYHTQLAKYLKSRNWGIAVISKSGTTTEPAIAFRLLKDQLQNQFGLENLKQRIIAITDAKKGALRMLADQEGYKTFVIPNNVGGRYSVLTPVGLVPLAVAGFDIRGLCSGALQMMQDSRGSFSLDKNLPARYAAARYGLYQKGKKLEVLSNFNPALHDLAEWWKQLFGESEGKENKGLFPASVDFTSDLHSMGQYLQEGERMIFETFLLVDESFESVTVPETPSDLDQLNYLKGEKLEKINLKAAQGTIMAHVDGGLPVITLSIPKLDEYNLGQLFYFFELACGISGYLISVNPFDQPGVEAYKKNMFALLGKPGFEQLSAVLQERLK